MRCKTVHIRCSAIFVTFFIVLCTGVERETKKPTATNSNVVDKQETTAENAKNMFQNLFRMKRLNQIDSIKRIQSFKKYDAQHKIITLMFEKLFNVIITSRTVVESSGYIPGSDFPENETVKESLALILENTALFGEIVLRLPKIAHKILANETHKQWHSLIQWSIGFSNSTDLFDSKTIELISLVVQELGMVEKNPDYINPYSEELHVKEKKEDTNFKPEKFIKKKKKPIRKGPRLSKKVEL